jgi:dihydroneopterin aldolase
VRIELVGIELHGFHGVHAEERERGQRFVYDVELEVGEQGASDRLEEAVDYRLVAACVKELNERPVRLLEALASSLADELMARFPVSWVRVRVRKPEVRPAGVELDFAAVVAERP